jgi:sulfofructose kinase
VAGKVLCVGVAVLDNIFAVAEMPREPTKVFARNFRQIGGGPAANAAVTIAKLKGMATLWARVGDDPIGIRLIDELKGCGVSVDTVRRIPGRATGVSAVLVDGEGDRFIVAFADRALDSDASWLPLHDLTQFDVVLCDVRWPTAAKRVLQAAAAYGVRTVLDADLTDDDAVENLIGLASHVIFSKLALAKLTGTNDPETGLRLASEQSNGIVSVTLGAQGYMWLEHGKIYHTAAAEVDVVDTLAAGDVFHGAFALALAEDSSIQQAARFATATAGLKCTRWGGRATIPTRDEVAEFLSAELAFRDS